MTVGEAADLTLDATHTQVGRLALTGHNGNSVVPFAAVRHIGKDAVTIDDSLIVQAPSDKNDITERGISTLNGVSVMNQDGVIVGIVDDVAAHRPDEQTEPWGIKVGVAEVIDAAAIDTLVLDCQFSCVYHAHI